MSESEVLRTEFPSKPASMMASMAKRPMDVLFLLGLLTIPLQVVQVDIAQPGQIWMLLTLPFVVLARSVRLSFIEIVTFLAFIAYAIALTTLQGYPRIKAGDQIFKFAVIYPGFYYVGRGFGTTYARRPPPVGYGILALLLAVQVLVQALKPPYLYQELDFAEGALHGTFKERNWIAMYFFMASYFLFESQSAKSAKDAASFLILNAIVTFFSQSKTVIVACGGVVFFRSRLSPVLKVLTIIIGAYLYWQFFASDLSGDMLRVRLEDERGLAFDQSLHLLSSNILGYGFGYVEAYFSGIALAVQGLGEGTNSVFSVPLDLMIIAGAVGLVAWLVFFCGFGLGATTILAPIAALSLLNPLHQSEIVYFFIGMLLSGAIHRRSYDAAEPEPSS